MTFFTARKFTLMYIYPSGLGRLNLSILDFTLSKYQIILNIHMQVKKNRMIVYAFRITYSKLKLDPKKKPRMLETKVSESNKYRCQMSRSPLWSKNARRSE